MQDYSLGCTYGSAKVLSSRSRHWAAILEKLQKAQEAQASVQMVKPRLWCFDLTTLPETLNIQDHLWNQIQMRTKKHCVLNTLFCPKQLNELVEQHDWTITVLIGGWWKVGGISGFFPAAVMSRSLIFPSPPQRLNAEPDWCEGREGKGPSGHGHLTLPPGVTQPLNHALAYKRTCRADGGTDEHFIRKESGIIVRMVQQCLIILLPLWWLFPGVRRSKDVTNRNSLMLGIMTTRSREWGIEC